MAAPKAGIRIIPRPRVEEGSPAVVPIPSRDPFPAFQGEYSEMKSPPCIRDEREVQPGKAYILDLCLLGNVTIEAKITKQEMEIDVTGRVSKSTAGEDDAPAVSSASEDKSEPKIPTILG
ncbi:hypothetical protein PsorP6_003866 [Peronosclerospora sorghi]|uniref:Uncharacterized protein n=1 Tax=Peronosclerospora sorghi TaxID=230839 RepID=A0ACC0VR88_9STRA|nr:hypothetical protein PsorP6_003866 [Peronosclerospora sorghi]